MELLVAIVILGFVMTLVSEAIFQVAQITRVADATTRGLTTRWGAGWSASGLFANLAIPEESKVPAFEGTSTRTSGYSTLPLDGGGTGLQPFELELRAGAERGSTELVVLRRSESSVRAEANVVASFASRAEFAYVDRAGKVQTAWPATTRSTELDAEELPRAVVVRDPGSGQVLMWYPFLGETARPPPRGKPFWESL